MTSRATRIRIGLLVALILWGIGGPVGGDAWTLSANVEAAAAGRSQTTRTTFDPAFNMVGLLQAGSLGLPGEPVAWIITVTNRSTVVGTDLHVSDVLRDELRIDNAQIDRGIAQVSGQLVNFRLPDLLPGETIEMRIDTTVLQGPPSGVLVNQATLAATGPDGAITRNAVAEVFVPTGLPATGYPRIQMPGEGEPPAWTVGLVAFGTVALTAVYVWRRGRRPI